MLREAIESGKVKHVGTEAHRKEMYKYLEFMVEAKEILEEVSQFLSSHDSEGISEDMKQWIFKNIHFTGNVSLY